MTVQIDIKGDASGFTAAARQSSAALDEIKRGADSLNRSMATTSSATREAENALRDTERAGRNFGLALSAAAVSFGLFLRHSLDSLAALDDLAETTGMSVEALSGLRDVARVSGNSIDQVAQASVRLSKTLAGVNDESKGAGAALKSIGLDIDDLRQLKPEDQLQAVAQAMNRFGDSGGKAAVATTLLGRETGARLLPFLKDLAEHGDLNASVTAQQAAEAEKLQKEWNRLKGSAADLGEAIAKSVVPALNEMIGRFREERKEGESFFGALARMTTGRTRLGDVTRERDLLLKQAQAPGIDSHVREALLAQANSRNEEILRLQPGYEEKAVASGSKPEIDFTAPDKTKAGRDPMDRYNRIEESIRLAKQAGKELEALAIHKRELERATTSMLAPMDRELDQLGRQIEREREHVAGIGLTKVAQAELVASKLELTAATREEYAANLENAAAHAGEFRDAYISAAAAARAQAKALVDLAALKREGGVKEAAAEAGKKIEEEWKRTSENIERSLTDALMRGFEGGKDAGKNALDALKNMFRTAVLQPMIRPLVEPVAQAASEFGRSLSSGSGGGLSGIVSGLGDWIGSLFENANGGVYDSPSLHHYVNGVYDSPRTFAFAKGGVFAEAGPEAIMPLARDARGRLGVRSEGGGAPIVNLTQHINIDSRSDQASIRAAMAMAKSEAVAAIRRSLREGGEFARATGVA